MLRINGVIVAYFADVITTVDGMVLDAIVGSHLHQQSFEALALMVALRVWAHHWQGNRTLLHVRSDNATALSNVLTMRASSKPLR